MTWYVLIAAMLLVALPSLCVGQAALGELTRDADWEYRVVVDGKARAWSTDLQEAIRSLGPAARTPRWPRSWVTFTPWDAPAGAPRRSDDPASLKQVPSQITLNGVSACRGSLPLYGGTSWT